MAHPDTLASNGPDFYDDPEVFESYQRARMRANSPNDLLEQPVIWELLNHHTIAGARILDLGCGDGAFGQALLGAGCRSYTGVEGSRRMLELAKERLAVPQAHFILADLAEWESPRASFDIVLSRLALHYVDDLTTLFARIFNTLSPGGRFIFSVEHPVITSCNRSRGDDGNGQRQDWVVDDYFITGARRVLWLNKWVVKYHRTIEEYFMALQNAQFTVTHLRESRPQPHLFNDEVHLQRRSRIPLFLFLAARRDDG